MAPATETVDDFQKLIAFLTTEKPITKRVEAVNTLISYFKADEQGSQPQSQSQKLFDDKAYHSVYEALFRCTRIEKEAYFIGQKSQKSTDRTRNACVKRLENCAEALRLAVQHGASKVKRKTVRAIVDHITQTLLDSDNNFFEPLLKGYVKALSALLNVPVIVETLATFIPKDKGEDKGKGWKDKGEGWEVTIDFCLNALSRFLGAAERDLGTSSRASPAPGTPATSRAGSVGLFSAHGQVNGQLALDFLTCVKALTSASNAPVLRRAETVSQLVLRVLRQIKVGELQRESLSILNSILVRVQTEDIALAKTIATALVPVLSHCWQPRSLSRDAMLNSIRDEMLKTLYGVHLYLESLLLEATDDKLLQDTEDLLDTLWSEYSRRDDKTRLHLEDVTFSAMQLPADHPSTMVFGLRPYHLAGEQNWALLENIALLETVYAKSSQRDRQHPEDEPDRKRPRVIGSSNRIRQKLGSPEAGVQLTALQLIPFLSALKHPSLEEVKEVLVDLSQFISTKQGSVASWAMVACSSLAAHETSRDPSLSAMWKQVWKIGVRSLSLPPTSRSACVLLDWILKAKLVPDHELAGDVNQIITTADISGPAMLVDSSLVLMLTLLRFRNAIFPNASQSTSSHVIRWASLKWDPSESAYASFHAVHAAPLDLINLLRACYEMPALCMNASLAVFGGPVAQFRANQKQRHAMIRYLLLLEDEGPPEDSHKAISTDQPKMEETRAADLSSSHSTKRLILELLFPKFGELSPMVESWHKRGSDNTAPVSTDRLVSVVSACIVGAFVMPELVGLNSSRSRDLEITVFGIVEGMMKAISESPQNEVFFNLVLQASAPYIPTLGEAELTHFKREQPYALRLFATISNSLLEKSRRESPTDNNPASMDLDDEFDSQATHKSATASRKSLPRGDITLNHTPEAFYLDTSLRLHLLRIIRADDGELGRVPDPIVDHLLELSDEDLLSCRFFMQELFASDVVTPADLAIRIVKRIGETIRHFCCEAAICTLIDIMEGFITIWTDEELEISNRVGDLYHWLVTIALPNNSLSTTAQIWFSRLLFRLLEVKSMFASQILELPSTRSTLLTILKDAPMDVRFFIGVNLPRIFGLYVLKAHDDVFVDILEKLPREGTEGFAFRLFVFAELACKWPTLLRRGTYHVFETAPNNPTSVSYATSSLKRISRYLNLSSPQELFTLFAPQILFTWLAGDDSIDKIPYSIFGFSNLAELLSKGQSEAVGIMIMRGHETDARELAKTLNLSIEELVTQSFSKIMAYSIAHDSSSKTEVTGESRMRKIIGAEPYNSHMILNFADILTIFFETCDQESPIEKWFRRVGIFAYAADIMEEIKAFGHLNTTLPPNQQPMFKAKFLQHQILHLVKRTNYELREIWTPALVVFVARKLLNTIHPALGPLHACSVLRKIRVLICLADNTALYGYPLEMLLHSLRAFVVDPECADDALGITQYLLTKGSDHLVKFPSFLAGYALSCLADLRVFLESSQSSTTQESQFKATKSRAQLFHSWFSKYLANYKTSAWKDETQREAFKAITQSAANIRAMGNAEKGTHESKLLLEILKDWGRKHQLLNEPARSVALSMLCGSFNVPPPTRLDVIESDEEALAHGAAVWMSCSSKKLSSEYLAWAGRVIGRSFAASGDVPPELLRESRLQEYRKKSPVNFDFMESEEALLSLVEALTASSDNFRAGLAEAALRVAVSDAIYENNRPLVTAYQKSLSESLQGASHWGELSIPRSDRFDVEHPNEAEIFSAEFLESPDWAQQLTTLLAQSVPGSVALRVLPPILTKVKGFAEQAFPFIVHNVLEYELDQTQGMKQKLSEALKEWLASTSPAARDNQKLLINTILYLRTQADPNETSIADRLHWLEVNFSTAAAAATRCGMYKVALLFAELASTEITRQSRRSSAIQGLGDTSEILLDIFENIDDPDAYYGLTQDASLSTVLARLEYENDGAKSLAFRGAQYDSHLRRRDVASQQDGQALIKALSSLGLAGLSNSLLQTQQSLDGSSKSLDSTFITARRLEIWNLPAPPASENWAVTVYKAHQSMHQASDIDMVRSAVHDGLARTLKHLTGKSLNTLTLRHQLGALATLAELDDVLNVGDLSELNGIINDFQARSKWMMSGQYDDVSQILSCRETTLSMWSQHHNLRPSRLTPADARLAQIRGMLVSSDIYRFHRATQETLNLSTTLTDLIKPSEQMGLTVDAAIRMEAANSLWDQGEMISSIRMLQNIDKDSSLKKQTVPVSRSDLLSKIGYQVSVARLESPDNIQKKYLEPALKELKGKSEGKEAGRVYHQFAMFCDEQLQNPDGLEDLARLQNLKKGKNDEVTQLKALITSTLDSKLKNRYSVHLLKAKQWLDLDQQELHRVEQTRSEFVRLSLQNYLLSLAASDEYNNDALRFTALWLERSEDDMVNETVKRYLSKVPTRKFAPLINQLSSRLQDQKGLFQITLLELVYSICLDHPYHGMYQIWSGARTRINNGDEVALSRQRATDHIAKAIIKSGVSAAKIWPAIDATSRVYHLLAMERDASRHKSGHKMAIKNSSVGSQFLATLAKFPIPPPTMQMPLLASCDYSNVPMIIKFEPQMSIASGVSAPKIITAIGNDGQRYKQLVKGGNDDLRQDAIMEQVFAAVSELLKHHRTTRQRNLGIRTYKVLPLTSSSGVIEFVSNTIPLHEYLMPAHETYYPKDLKGAHCRKEIMNAQSTTVDNRVAVYHKVTEKFHPVMRYFFMEWFPDPDEWFARRTAYTRTTAAISMLGHVLGLGDRHGHNILLDTKTGEVVHIDLGIAFEMGRVLPVPELVPFRLTRDIVDGMGITKTEGVFRRCCEFTLDALREETYSIMTILDVLRYDPLYSWSMSPLRMARLQNARMGADENDGVDDDQAAEEDHHRAGGGNKKSNLNEPSEANRALEVVRKKLSKTLSVMATVNDLINQATDERNLAVLYCGWAAYA
ncbi:Serine/threonine-protein kinase tel1 [Neurospora sp. IMI 360204]|nr:Serine/threonine-protein kinase tel1 [Neurospora sp. IMI 360204]